MSDNRDARGAPRAPAKPPPVPNAARSPKPGTVGPTPAFRPRAPSAPQISPPAPPTPKKPVAVEALDDHDLVDSGGWDTADTATSLPKEEPKKAAAPAMLERVPTPAPTPRPLPKPPPVAVTPPGHQSVTTPIAQPIPPAAIPTPVPTPPPTPEPTPLPTPRQPVVKKDESVGSVVRAAVEEAVTPHIEKSKSLEQQNRELMAKISQLQGEVEGAKREVEVIKKASQIPQEWIQPQGAKPASGAPAAAGSVAPPMRPSMHSTSYGPVITLPPGAPRPGEIDLSNVGPIDLPDFGQRKRIVGRIIIVLMLGLVLAAFIAMVVSRN